MRGLERALVIGGAGFYGGWLVAKLAAQGIETTVLDRNADPTAPGVARAVLGEAHEIDLVGLIHETRADAIFQLAGTGLVPTSISDPMGDLLVNVRTTVATLEAARSVTPPPLVLLVSSAAVYGEQQQLTMDEDHPLAPLSPYGISKLAAEQYVRLYADLHGVPGLSVRPFSLYGPRQRKLVVYDLLARIVSGEDPLVVAAPADVTRDFVWVGDAAAALVTLARSAPAHGEAYNVASGVATSLADLVGHLMRFTGMDTDVRFDDSQRPGNPLHWAGDASRARALGATFDTRLEQGLEETVRWFVAAGVVTPGELEHRG